MFEKRRKEIQARREEIRAFLAETAEEELEKLECELDSPDSEEATIARREDAISHINRSGQQGRHGDKVDSGGRMEITTEELKPFSYAYIWQYRPADKGFRHQRQTEYRFRHCGYGACCGH